MILHLYTRFSAEKEATLPVNLCPVTSRSADSEARRQPSFRTQTPHANFDQVASWYAESTRECNSRYSTLTFATGKECQNTA